MLAIRDEAYKALEIARAAKQIGTALQAEILIQSSDADLVEFLQSFGDDLRFVFITSGVSFGTVGESAYRSDNISGLAIEVRNAAGTKCERCWNYTRDVGSTAEWPPICVRCAANVEAVLAETERA